MMPRLCIRFLRTGNFKRASFLIVVTNSKKRRNNGRVLEKLGFYNPSQIKGRELGINTVRLGFWLNRGAILNRSVKMAFCKFIVGEEQLREYKSTILRVYKKNSLVYDTNYSHNRNISRSIDFLITDAVLAKKAFTATPAEQADHNVVGEVMSRHRREIEEEHKHSYYSNFGAEQLDSESFRKFMLPFKEKFNLNKEFLIPFYDYH